MSIVLEGRTHASVDDLVIRWVTLKDAATFMYG